MKKYYRKSGAEEINNIAAKLLPDIFECDTSEGHNHHLLILKRYP